MPVPMRQRVHRRPGERPVHQVRRGRLPQRRLRGERGRRALQERRLGPVVEAPGRPRPQPDLGHRDPADPAGVRLPGVRDVVLRRPDRPGHRPADVRRLRRRGRGRSSPSPPPARPPGRRNSSSSASRCDPGRSRCSSARTADRQEPGCRGPLDAIRPHDGDGWGQHLGHRSLPGGRTYACGDEGLLVSDTGDPTRTGACWACRRSSRASSAPSLSRPRSRRSCSPRSGTRPFVDLLLASRDEVFYEADIQEYPTQPVTWKIAWTQFLGPDDDPTTTNIEGGKSRVPFVVTNDRAGGFDLWLGDGSLWRVPCSSNQTRDATRIGPRGRGAHGPPRGMDKAHGDPVTWCSTRARPSTPAPGCTHRTAVST